MAARMQGTHCKSQDTKEGTVSSLPGLKKGQSYLRFPAAPKDPSHHRAHNIGDTLAKVGPGFPKPWIRQIRPAVTSHAGGVRRVCVQCCGWRQQVIVCHESPAPNYRLRRGTAQGRQRGRNKMTLPLPLSPSLWCARVWCGCVDVWMCVAEATLTDRLTDDLNRGQPAGRCRPATPLFGLCREAR